jgi:hypothetical protein
VEKSKEPKIIKVKPKPPRVIIDPNAVYKTIREKYERRPDPIMPVIVEEEISVEPPPDFDKIEDVKLQVQEDLESELRIFDVLKEHKLEVVTDSHKDAYMLEKADELKKVPLDDRPDIPDALIDIMKEEAQTLKLQK